MKKLGAFANAFPYQDDVLTLPVSNIDTASTWYSQHFGMAEIERSTTPNPSVVLERDGVKLGFSITGKDPEQDGAAILVRDIELIKAEFRSSGVTVGDERIDERDGQKLNVFFVVAPDGLCFYFHEPVS